MRPVPSAVKRRATEHGMALFQPATLKAAENVERIRATGADALVVAAYGLILPQTALAASRLGAINIHASLLPRWRGAAPIQRALLAGDARTGISIMQMDAGLDTGPVLAQRSIPIDDADDAGTLHDKLAELGASMIVDVLPELDAGRVHPLPQPAEGVTYARKIDKAETRLDWARPADELERAVRAFRPSPGAFTTLDGEPLKIWRARVADVPGSAGLLTQRGDRLLAGCGVRSLQLEELQRAGGKRLSASDFIRGRPLAPGARFV